MNLRTWSGSHFPVGSPPRFWRRFVLGWLRLLVMPWHWPLAWRLWSERPHLPLVARLLNRARRLAPSTPTVIVTVAPGDHEDGRCDLFEFAHNFEDAALGAVVLEDVARELRRRARQELLQ